MNSAGKPLMTYNSETVDQLTRALAVFSDLMFGLDCLRSLIESYDKLDQIQKKSLFHSALMAYFKAYPQGKKFGFNREFMATLPGDPIGLHEKLKELRDKWIAHRSGIFEDHYVGVIVDDGKVIGRGTFSVQFMGWDVEDLKMVYNFFVAMKDQVKTHVSKYETAFNSEADSLDLSKIKLRDAKFTVK